VGPCPSQALDCPWSGKQEQGRADLELARVAKAGLAAPARQGGQAAGSAGLAGSAAGSATGLVAAAGSVTAAAAAGSAALRPGSAKQSQSAHRKAQVPAQAMQCSR